MRDDDEVPVNLRNALGFLAMRLGTLLMNDEGKVFFARALDKGLRKAGVSLGVPEATEADDTDLTADIPRFPHCDTLILHSPGTCRYCDRHPDWQQYRHLSGIAFSDMSTEEAIDHRLVPCPSTYYRTPALRDLWGGNTPS